LHFRSPDAQVPPQWPEPVLCGNVSVNSAHKLTDAVDKADEERGEAHFLVL
jgi:hypothetical protein